MQRAPDNGDGGTFLGRNGDRIFVFGTFLVDLFFDDEARNRIAQAKKLGWDISYSRIEPDWASYSGTKGDRSSMSAATGCAKTQRPSCIWNTAAGIARPMMRSSSG